MSLFSFLEAGLKTKEAYNVATRNTTRKAAPVSAPMPPAPVVAPLPPVKNMYEDLVNIKSSSGERKQKRLHEDSLNNVIEKGLWYYAMAFDITKNIKYSKSNTNTKRFQEKQRFIPPWIEFVNGVLETKLATASDEEIKKANLLLNDMAGEIDKHPKTLEYVNKIRKMIRERKTFKPVNVPKVEETLPPKPLGPRPNQNNTRKAANSSPPANIPMPSNTPQPTAAEKEAMEQSIKEHVISEKMRKEKALSKGKSFIPKPLYTQKELNVLGKERIQDIKRKVEEVMNGITQRYKNDKIRKEQTLKNGKQFFPKPLYKKEELNLLGKERIHNIVKKINELYTASGGKRKTRKASRRRRMTRRR